MSDVLAIDLVKFLVVLVDIGEDDLLCFNDLYQKVHNDAYICFDDFVERGPGSFKNALHVAHHPVGLVGNGELVREVLPSNIGSDLSRYPDETVCFGCGRLCRGSCQCLKVGSIKIEELSVHTYGTPARAVVIFSLVS